MQWSLRAWLKENDESVVDVVGGGCDCGVGVV